MISVLSLVLLNIKIIIRQNLKMRLLPRWRNIAISQQRFTVRLEKHSKKKKAIKEQWENQVEALPSLSPTTQRTQQQ